MGAEGLQRPARPMARTKAWYAHVRQTYVFDRNAARGRRYGCPPADDGVGGGPGLYCALQARSRWNSCVR